MPASYTVNISWGAIDALPKASTLTDTFGLVDAGKWPSTSSASVLGNGRGLLTLPAVGSFASLSTGTNRYDLTNSSASVELAVLPTAATSSTYLQAVVSLSPENKIFIGRESGNLLMREVAAGVVSDTTLTYDPVFHRWVRLRHDGSQIHWETSNNGSTWTIRRSKTTTVDLASVVLAVESGWQVSAGAGRTEIAHFNTAPVLPLTYSPPPFHFGVLRVINDTNTDKADDHYAGGDRIGMYEVFWDRAEPTTNGTFSSAYATQVTNETTTIRNTGLKLTLGLGLAYPPTWTNTIANYRFVNESGAFSTDRNYVFNQLMRDEVEDYFDWINSRIPFSNVWSVRITAASGGELLYPSAGLWGYDANAQGGAARPATVPPCPYPAWTPGTGTTTQAAEWIDWYIDALADCASWQMKYLRSLGFTGWFEILTPGSGTRPSVLATEVAARLSGYSATTGVGAIWHKVYQKLATRRGVVTYCSSMADNSGSNDVPTGADMATSITSTGANGWSAYRWLTRIANEYGMPNGGENPGRGALADSYYQDTTSAGMMAKLMAQAAGGGALATYWAHGEQLWGLSTLTHANWTSKIAAVNTTGAGTPPNPP